jgi:hypothetical protein
MPAPLGSFGIGPKSLQAARSEWGKHEETIGGIVEYDDENAGVSGVAYRYPVDATTARVFGVSRWHSARN